MYTMPSLKREQFWPANSAMLKAGTDNNSHFNLPYVQKSCPMVYGESLYQNEQHFLDIQLYRMSGPIFMIYFIKMDL